MKKAIRMIAMFLVVNLVLSGTVYGDNTAAATQQENAAVVTEGNASADTVENETANTGGNASGVTTETEQGNAGEDTGGTSSDAGQGTEVTDNTGTPDPGSEGIDTGEGSGTEENTEPVEGSGEESDDTEAAEDPEPEAQPEETPEKADEKALITEQETDRPIADGTYILQSSLNTDYVLDVEKSSKDAKANILISKYDGRDSQKFKITYVDKGYYKIENALSGKAADVCGAEVKNFANVWQYDWNGTKAQLWKPVKNADGSYTFASALSEKYVLDVYNGKAAEGANVSICGANGTKAQSFVLTTKKTVPVKETKKRSAIDGTFLICSAISKSKVLDVKAGSTSSGANVQIFKSNNSAAQVFRITEAKKGFYKIINAKSGYALDVKGGKAANGQNVQQYKWNGSKAQLWKLKKNKDGSYTIASALNEKYVLDVRNGSVANGSNIQIYKGNNSKAQKWFLKSKKTWNDALYRVQVGSYKVRSNAIKQLQRVRSAGFNAIVLKCDDNLYYVQAGAYKVKANADKQLKKIKAAGFNALITQENKKKIEEIKFPITKSQFLASCKKTMDTARTNGYVYGHSTAVNPTTDKKISCDRLVAKALYDLGYTDQKRGGETCGTFDAWLSAHGFVRSTSWKDVKAGSIMLVKHKDQKTTSHMFVFASDFNMSTMTGDRFDAGSNWNIKQIQPMRNVGFWYRTDSIIVYNIPE